MGPILFLPISAFRLLGSNLATTLTNVNLAVLHFVSASGCALGDADSLMRPSFSHQEDIGSGSSGKGSNQARIFNRAALAYATLALW